MTKCRFAGHFFKSGTQKSVSKETALKVNIFEFSPTIEMIGRKLKTPILSDKIGRI
jgi:hypothetical protein